MKDCFIMSYILKYRLKKTFSFYDAKKEGMTYAFLVISSETATFGYIIEHRL